ncbi:MAG: class I SAM-dependent methyltransferase [Pseudomonadota bacterium]
MAGRVAASGLAERLRDLIRENGPISIADYMQICLADDRAGYYKTRDPFGEKGDFVTAPEISQMFGELIGVWLRMVWQETGRPRPFHLVELGPGRGTLMADILRAAGGDAHWQSAVQLHLVETSPRLRAHQKERLSSSPLSGSWHDTLDTVPDGPVHLVANEFFDALPVRQWVRVRAGWSERVVGLDAQGHLVFGLRPAPQSVCPDDLPRDPPAVGDVLEFSPVRNACAREIGRRIADAGGTALIIDYGHPRTAYGDTVQAVADHRTVPVLQDPGNADLTAHVDFDAFARACRQEGIHTSALMTQADFLLSLGLLERAGRLGHGKDQETQRSIEDAVERLAGPDQMGHLFKVLCLHDRDVPPFPFR